MGIAWHDWLSLALFVSIWLGYTLFTRWFARGRLSLSSVLHVHRLKWMSRLLNRDIRVADASFLGNLERNVNFFASSCILITAGLLTTLSMTDEIQMMLGRLSFIAALTAEEIELRIAVLVFIYVYAFFTFTWSIRQFGFANIILGAAPGRDDTDLIAADRRTFVKSASKVIDLASRSYNYGLRAFYFSLAVFAWFIAWYYFIAATLTVVVVLYQREFRSSVLKAMARIESVGDTIAQDDDERVP